MEDKRSSKLVTGCGIGCGVVVLILILAGVGLYTYVTHALGDTEEVDKLSDELRVRFGTVEEYSPDPVFFITKNSVEKFINVRDTLLSRSGEFLKSIDEMTAHIESGEEKDKSFWDVMDIIGSGFGLVPGVINYYYNRNQLLLNNEMGMGEYTFLYITFFYCLLDKPLNDGPEFELQPTGNEHGDSQNQNWKFGEKVYEDREARMTLKVNKLYRSFLLNFLNAQSDFTKSQIVDEVQTEYEMLKEDKFRVPWRDGLPEEVRTNLEFYTVRLQKGYEKMLNPFDFRDLNE